MTLSGRGHPLLPVYLVGMELDLSCLPEVVVCASGFEGGYGGSEVECDDCLVILSSGMTPCTLVSGYPSYTLKMEAVYVKYWYPYKLLHYTMPQPRRP
jgi:hypothetical protein